MKEKPVLYLVKDVGFTGVLAGFGVVAGTQKAWAASGRVSGEPNVRKDMGLRCWG
jgi:hypothetical protein